MRREGRQHGMVKYLETWPFQRPKTRIVNKFDSPPTTNSVTKVSSKPTNHSKYTSRCRHRPRCGGCHSHPVSKSEHKTKGTHKLNSRDVLLNHQLVSWRGGDKGGGFNFAGISASWALDHLSSECLDYEDQGDHTFALAESCNFVEEDQEGTGFDDCDDDFGFCHVWNQVDSDEEDWCVVSEGVVIVD